MSRAHETCVWLIVIGFNLQVAQKIKRMVLSQRRPTQYAPLAPFLLLVLCSGMATGQVDTSPADQQTTIEDVTSVARILEQVTTPSLGTGASSSSCGNWIKAMDEMKSLIVDLARDLISLSETVQDIFDRQQRLESEWEQASGAAQGSISSRQKCKNGFYNGKRCASTTRYTFGNHGPGSCGCGADSSSLYPWVKSKYTAAVNEALFNHNSKFGTWCGATCGRCYKLTTTGGYVPGQRRAHSAGHSITVMVTDACGRDADASWCGQGLNGTNTYGYLAHFNIVNDSGQIDRLGWDNPEVTYVEVACGSGGAPTSDEYNTCQCNRITEER